MEELLNPKEAAKMLGVSPDCLRHWEKNGKIKAIRTVGKHRRYRLADVKKLLELNQKS